MCSSVIHYIKLLLLNTRRGLTALQKLNCKLKLLIALQLLICIYAVVVIKTNLDGNQYPYSEPDSQETLVEVRQRESRHSPTAQYEARPLWRDPDFEQMTSNLTGGLDQLSQKEIIILQWTPYWGSNYPAIVLNSDKCSILKTGTTQQPPIPELFDKPCRITLDHRYLSGSHAVVFHSPDLHIGYANSSHLPKSLRPQNQILIWYQTESPLLTVLNLTAHQNTFNWTMSYRRDSDVHAPYAYIFPSNISTSPNPSTSAQLPDHYRKSLKTKVGLAAWIVSSCVTPSLRENFVGELQKYIQVDIFGTCGQKPCPSLQDDGGYFACYRHIQSNYKFYFAFENSLCVDYITEKFYTALQTDMVPVVYGGGIDDQMDYLAIAPENSFIDARKFKSPQDLANYLIYLDNNNDEYLKYFEWKGRYQVVYKDYGQFGLGWCNLCQRVFEQIEKREEEPLGNKWYSDLYTWWNYVKVSTNLSSRLSLASQSKSPVSPVGQSFQYSLEKLKPACVQPTENFTSYRKYYKVLE